MIKTNKTILQQIQELLESVEPTSFGKYISAKEAESLIGVPAKTILNRSVYPESHIAHIPSVRLKGGRKKMFERKVIERLFK